MAARAEGSEREAGVSLLLVPADAPGLERTPLVTMDQTRRQAQLEQDILRLREELLVDWRKSFEEFVAVIDQAAS